MTASVRSSLSAGWYEPVPDIDGHGIRAFTTTRAAGSYGVGSDEPVRDVMGRWDRLRAELAASGPRLATAHQVHGDRVLQHGTGWEGWLRAGDADGHLALERGTGMAVSIADCVPVFIAHPSGAIALLHSGWRGTAARIVERAIDVFGSRGVPANELTLHLGPSICGSCYEVSPDVFGQLTGRTVDRHDRSARRHRGSCASSRRPTYLYECELHPLRQRPILLASRWRRWAPTGRNDCGSVR
jgi:polyphenol oxidase